MLWLLDRLDELAATRADRLRLLRLRGEALAARGCTAAARPRCSARAHRRRRESSMAKLAIAVLMQKTAAAAVELLGPAGLLEEGTGTLTGRVAAFHRAAVATTISGGAAEVQRSVIARQGLACPAVGLPLEGLRVLEYAQYVAGPFAGMLLADLGADVVKIEPPAGDAWRRYEPFDAGESRYFYALNRNKRSVVLDLKTAEGRRASRALIARADAVLHNQPPARAARCGLDRESVARGQPASGVVHGLGARQRRPGRRADRVRPRRAGALRAAARRRAARGRDPAPRGRHRDGGLHRRAARGGLDPGRARRARRRPRRRARARGVAARRGARRAGAAVRVGRVGRRRRVERPRGRRRRTTSPSAASGRGRRRSSSRTTAPTAPPTASSC